MQGIKEIEKVFHIIFSPLARIKEQKRDSQKGGILEGVGCKRENKKRNKHKSKTDRDTVKAL